jgi:tetratricopeptide (TPR) repeat protein
LAVPALTDIKCDAAAEATLKSIVESSTIVGRRASWVVFLLGAGRGLEGLQAALELPEPEYGVEMKARLLANAVASQRRAALGAKAIEWDKLLDAASAWLTAKKANSNPMLIMLAGVLADARGDVDAAIASFESVLRTNPDSEMAANSLAFLLAVTGRDPARAEALSSKLVESVGPRPHLLDTRARARVALDRGAEALKDADAAVVQSPMKATYWWRVAQCREAARDLAARNLAFQKALQMGLKKEQLHPLEWAAFDLLRASLGRA